MKHGEVTSSDSCLLYDLWLGQRGSFVKTILVLQLTHISEFIFFLLTFLLHRFYHLVKANRHM